MRYCENCGKEIPEGSGFCPECGAHQTVISAGRNFDLRFIAILIIGVIQMGLWNAKSITLNLYFLKPSFSINDALSTASSLSDYIDVGNLKTLKVVNFVFYTFMILIILYSLIRMCGFKFTFPVALIELVVFVALLGFLVYTMMGSSAEYIEFGFVYALMMLSCLINVYISIRIK